MVKALNRAKAATSTTGTGTITIGAAETGYTDFRKAYTDYDYRIVIEDGNDWEISTSTITHGSWVEGYNVSEADGQIYSLAFKPDGTKMYVGHSGTTDGIYQYSLSTAWDVTTASYDSKSLAVTFPYSILFNSNGTKLFVLISTGDVDEYTLSTAYDVSTAGSATSHNFSLTGTRGMAFNDDGTKIHTVKDEGSYAGVYEYSLSTAYDITSISGGSPYAHSQTFSTEGLSTEPVSQAYDIKWNSDGTRLFILHNSVSTTSANNISQWKCSTAYDITTAQFDGYALYNLDYFSVASTRTQIDWVAKAYSIAVKSDTEIFAAGWISDLSTECTVAKYTVGTTTATRTLIESSTGSLLNLSGSAKVFHSFEADDIATWNDGTFDNFTVHQEVLNYGSIGLGTNDGGVHGLRVSGNGNGGGGIQMTPNPTPYIQGSSGSITLRTAEDFWDTSYNMNFQAQGYFRFSGSADQVQFYQDELFLAKNGAVITWEGVGDAYETSLGVTNPTADRTINLPNASGTVAVYSADGTNGQVLSTDGSGNLSFIDAGGGNTFDSSIIFEGATADDYQTTVTAQEPTSDRTITLPNQSGALMIWKNYMVGDAGDNNIAIGQASLLNNTSGQVGNIAIGYQSMEGANYGLDTNTCVGHYSGNSLTAGNDNTLIGAYAGYDRNNTRGVAVGYQAGGGGYSYSTYVGAYAGDYNSTGKDYQTSIGYMSMNDNYGDYSTAVGVYSMTDGNHYQSTAVGAYSLNRSSTSNANYNTAVGYSAGYSAYSSDYETYVGYQAAAMSTYGTYGVAIGAYARSLHAASVSVGAYAGYSAQEQSNYSTLVGYQSGYDLDGGDYCTFVGYQAGYSGGSGSYNTGLGNMSTNELTTANRATGCGHYALHNLTSGDNNSGFGLGAGQNLTTGTNNTFLGCWAGFYTGSSSTNALTTGSNVTCVGYASTPTSSSATNEITLGDANISSLRCNVQTISSLSDERDKTAIEDLPYGLDFINDMRPVQFTWNRRDGTYGAKPDIGFIAQDLFDVELTHSTVSRTRLVNRENPTRLEADYVRSYPILVKAVQELSAKCDALEARVAELEGN